MTFLSPLFLVGIAAAAVPIVLHLLKRQPAARVRFAAVHMLKGAPLEPTRKRHVRERLLLALRIAALACFALVFARPFFASGSAAASGSATIVLLDTSYSLSAPGRFARAQQLALQAVARAPASDPVGVVTFSDEAETVAALSADHAAARDAINRAQVGAGGTSYRAGLAAAARALADRRGIVVVVTDLQESGWDAGERAAVSADTTIEIADVGALPPNFALTALRSEPGRVVATVRNSAAMSRETRVSLTVDGRPAGERMVSFAANQAADVVFDNVGRGTVISAAVADSTGLQADNVRYGVLEAGQPTILVVTTDGDLNRDGFYVDQALSATSADGPSYTVAGERAAALGARSQNGQRPYASIVLLSTNGIDRRGREWLAAYVRSGGGLLMAAGPDVDGELVKDVLGDTVGLQVTTEESPRSRTLAASDVRHPIFQTFGADLAALTLVQFQRVDRIGGNGCQVVARFTTGETALLDCSAGEGKALILASDVDRQWNDFPLHPSFVPFLHEAIRYLAGTRAAHGEYLLAQAPPGVPRTPGMATVAGGPVAAGQVAVNVDPKESEPARTSEDEFRAAVVHLQDAGVSDARVAARDREERERLWQYLLGAMIGVLVLEGLLASRTV